MLKMFKILLPLFLISILLLSFTGCPEKEPVQEKPEPASEIMEPSPEEVEPSVEELKQMVADSIAAVANAETYKFDRCVHSDLHTIWLKDGRETYSSTSNETARGMVNIASHEMQMTMLTVGIMDMKEKHRYQELTSEYYVFNDWSYRKDSWFINGIEAYPEWANKWSKRSLTADEWEEKTEDLISVYYNLQLGADMAGIDFLGYKELDGTEGYVLEITPTDEALHEWMQEEWKFRMEDDLKSLSYVLWLAKDDPLMMKLDLNLHVEDFFPEGSPEKALERTLEDINIELLLYDFNKPLSIQVPQEAAEAEGF